MSRAALGAQEYQRLDDIDRCAYMGEMLRYIWFARVFQPNRADTLVRSGYAVAREQQIPAWLTGSDTVRTHIFMSGRGAGKSRLATGYLIPELLERPELRVGILGPDYKNSVGVGIKGKSGIQTIIEAFDKTLIAKFDAVKNILHLVNGSQVFCYSSEFPKSVEGPEHHLVWVDEVAEIHEGLETYRVRLEPSVRLVGDKGEPARKIITGTPEATPLIADLWNKSQEYPESYAWTQMATRDNIENLDKEIVENLYREAGNSRFAQMKLEGHLILESPHALLNPDQIRTADISKDPSTADMVTLMVDSNHSDDAKSDECGMIVHGYYRGKKRDDDEVRVHADASIAGGPTVWPDRLVDVLHAYPEIDTVLVEDDKSMVIDFVKKVLHERLEEIGRPIKLKAVKHRNRSKKVRADPVAAFYVLGRVLHDPCARVQEWSDLSKLAWQWTSWNPKQTGTKKKSPDRLDADVYGVEYHLIRKNAPSSFYLASDVARW